MPQPARTALITGVYPTSLGAEHMRSMVNTPGFMRMYPQFLRDCGYYCVNNRKEDYNVAKSGKVWDESSNKAHWKKRQSSQPFFAVFNIGVNHESQIRVRPHALKHDPAKVRLPAYHPDVPAVRHDWAQYYDKITEMDVIVGSRLKELDDAGLADDTIVFFYGDNGSGMPRSKRWPYNSRLNVPLIIRVPERFKRLAPEDYRAGAVTGRLVDFVDFTPTLLSLAGIKPTDWMQDHAFVGRFAAASPKHIFGFRGRMDGRYDLVRSVRNDRFIYIRNYRPDLIYGQHLAYMFETPTTLVWKRLYDEGKLKAPQTFFWEPKPAEELYDLQDDPDEVRNLANSAQYRTVLAGLRAALHDQTLAIRDVGFITGSEMHRRAANTTPYALGHDVEKYPLDRILAMAELASLPKLHARGASRETADWSLSTLRAGLTDGDSGVRYWAALGLLMRGKGAVNDARANLHAALKDESPSVRVVAALALGRHGSADDFALALPVPKELAPPDKNGVYVSLEALSAIEWLGDKAAALKQSLRTMSRADPNAVERTANYVPRLFQHLLGEEVSGAPNPSARPKRKNRDR